MPLAAINEDAANALGAHLGEGDSLWAREGRHAQMIPPSGLAGKPLNYGLGLEVRGTRNFWATGKIASDAVLVVPSASECRASGCGVDFAPVGVWAMPFGEISKLVASNWRRHSSAPFRTRRPNAFPNLGARQAKTCRRVLVSSPSA
jgi:hypothetical protein